MVNKKAQAMLEAVLYLEAEGLTLQELSKKISASEEETAEYLTLFAQGCEEAHRGIELVLHGSMYKIIPKRSFYEDLRSEYGQRTRPELSRAAVETLSIIAYSQPITRVQIDALRGVSSSTQIRLLRTLGLIEQKGRSEALGRPALFCTTPTFLAQFGLSCLEELPALDAIDTLRLAKIE